MGQCNIFALPDLHQSFTELDAKQAQTTCANKIVPALVPCEFFQCVFSVKCGDSTSFLSQTCPGRDF